MSSLAFDALKRELFARYEAEIQELIEGQVPEGSEDGDGAEEQEEDLSHLLPKHLRLSYPRQHILCQRAGRDAKRPPMLPKRKTVAAEEAPEEKADEKDDEEAAAIGYDSQEVLRRRMHRLQEESVGNLWFSIVEEQRKKRERERGTAPAEEEGADGDVPNELPLTAEQIETADKETLAAYLDSVLTKGGCHSDEFTAQRLSILKRLALSIKMEQVPESDDAQLAEAMSSGKEPTCN